MKRVMTVLAALAVSAAVHAQSGGMKGMDMKDMDMKDMDKKGMNKKGMDKKGMDKKGGQGGVHNATGTVASVDEANGKVTINHDPIKSLNWPAMNMTFSVKDKKMLSKAKAGEKIRFSFVQSGSDYTITQIK